jgi:hypothetical protein
MVTYIALDFFWPIPRTCEVDNRDYFGTFTEKPADGLDPEGLDEEKSLKADGQVLAGDGEKM